MPEFGRVGAHGKCKDFDLSPAEHIAILVAFLKLLGRVPRRSGLRGSLDGQLSSSALNLIVTVTWHEISAELLFVARLSCELRAYRL